MITPQGETTEARSVTIATGRLARSITTKTNLSPPPPSFRSRQEGGTVGTRRGRIVLVDNQLAVAVFVDDLTGT